MAHRKFTKSEERLLQMFDTPNLLAGYRGSEGQEIPNPIADELLGRITEFLGLTLNRDHGTWYLRYVKFEALAEAERVGVELDLKERTFMSRLLKRDPQAYIFSSRTAVHYMKHNVDAEIPAITNFVYDCQPYGEVIERLEELEEDYFHAKNRFIPVRGDEEILMEYDGYELVDLLRSGCKEEAAAMRHCGNGEGADGERLLSLRSRQMVGDKEVWVPHVTIVMQDARLDFEGVFVSGYTSEIKGYANEKPSSLYHVAMAEFLRTGDYVLGMRGGGYMPQNNLSIGDFEPLLQRRILNAKPELISSLEHRIVADESTLGEDGEAWLLEREFRHAVNDEGRLEIETDMGAGELLDYADLPSLAKILRICDELVLERAYERYGLTGSLTHRLDEVLPALQASHPELYKGLASMCAMQSGDRNPELAVKPWPPKKLSAYLQGEGHDDNGLVALTLTFESGLRDKIVERTLGFAEAAVKVAASYTPLHVDLKRDRSTFDTFLIDFEVTPKQWLEMNTRYFQENDDWVGEYGDSQSTSLVEYYLPKQGDVGHDIVLEHTLADLKDVPLKLDTALTVSTADLVQELVTELPKYSLHHYTDALARCQDDLLAQLGITDDFDDKLSQACETVEPAQEHSKQTPSHQRQYKR